MIQLAGMEILIDMDFSLIDEKSVESYFKELISKFSDQLFSQETLIEVHLSEGSVRTVLIVAGVIYTAIGQYGSFRSGIDYMVNDSKLLKTIVLSQLIKGGLDESNILEAKRLQCVPDKIRRVLLKIERLENNLSKLSQEDQIKELHRIKISVKNVFFCLNDKRDQALFIDSINEKYIPNLPQIPDKIERHKILAREEDVVVKKRSIYTLMN